MPIRTQRNKRIWTWRRVVTVIGLLLTIGTLTTPIQWYIAVRGLQSEKQQQQNRNTAQTPECVVY